MDQTLLSPELGVSTSTSRSTRSTSVSAALYNNNQHIQPASPNIIQSISSPHTQSSHGQGNAHSSSTRKRATHQVSSSKDREREREQEASLNASVVGGATSTYRDVYAHPAAQQYLNQHPKRTIPKFGPYLLLQTLGEGEFGKVKLGLHGQWGEEVAVKLIRRAGVDGTVRMSKVEREIEVLKTLRHPNIVHLYDVIETDKYIGIIIEYASGGELFDHILAHRYLKEKDACKLFAQLISGVWYIHAKKIVHRDLKLENLLLDRNRNVIITDFGFANRFEHRADDLMQTSCGSPCYAAPELVISEGLYVGSAVDIWSCGVILYAMLAGYLPFDDDPENPDGDNINLLYRYIINTPLTFPEYVSADARDLLRRMLVPDPSKRADLRSIMLHTWLEPYRYLFERSVADLESTAAEQQRQKRLQYQKQIMKNVAQQQTPEKLSRSMSSAVTGSDRRAMVQSMQPVSTSTSLGAGPSSLATGYDTTGELVNSVYDARPARERAESSAPPSASKRAVMSAIVSASRPDDIAGPSSSGYSQPRAKPSKDSTRSRTKKTPTKSSGAAGSGSYRGAAGESPVVDATSTLAVASPSDTVRSKRDMRHTVQVEYSEEPPEPVVSVSSPVDSSSPTMVGDEDPFLSIATGMMRLSVNGSITTAREEIEVSESIPPTSTQPITNTSVVASGSGSKRVVDEDATPRKVSSPVPVPIVSPSNTIARVSSRSPSSSSVEPRIRVNGSPVNGALKDKGTPSSWSRSSATSPLAQFPLQAPEQSTVPVIQDVEFFSPPESSKASQGSNGASSQNISSPPSDAVSIAPSSSSSKRRIKGLSIDKIGFGKLVVSGNGVNGHGSRRQAASESMPPPTSFSMSKKTSSNGVVTSETKQDVVSASEDEKDKDKKRRRKTLDIMMDPIRNRTVKATKSRSIAVGADSSSPRKTDNFLSPGTLSSRLTKVSTPVAATFFSDVSRPPAKAPLSVSTNKAQKVMQWFRGGKYRQPSESGVSELTVPTDTELSSRDDRTPATSASYQNSSAMDSTSTIDRVDVPVILTPATPEKSRHIISPPSSWIPGRSVSHGLPSPVNLARGAIQAVIPKGYTYNHDAIRIHHGVVDRGTVTSGAPPEVFAHVTQVLLGMGMEVQKEAEYKYRCIRQKKRKDAQSVGLGLRDPISSNGSIAAFTAIGSATLNGIDQRGLPTSSSTTGMFRNLLMRRHSSRHNQNSSAFNSPSDSESYTTSNKKSSTLSPGGDFSPEPTSPAVTSTIIEPLYGEKTVDQGDEVRFSVELTRIDRLDDTFSLDIRRLKGNLRSYKFLYDTLRDRCNFSS